jgi:hypothetical protein
LCGNGETLVVAKLDRLSRGAQDMSTTVRLLASRKIAVIKSEGKTPASHRKPQPRSAPASSLSTPPARATMLWPA